MRLIIQYFSLELIEAIGWTIVHSIWQGAAIALLLTILLLVLKNMSAQIKYFLSFAALLGICVWAAYTFANSYQYAKEKQVLKNQMVSDPGYLKSVLNANNSKTAITANYQGNINIKTLKTRAFFQQNFYLIFSIWIIGMAIFILRLITGLLYTHRLRKHHISPIPEIWIQKIEAFAKQMKLKRKVEAFFSPLTNVPLTLGTIKPIILFPVSAFTGLTSKEIEAIIAHELAHVMRNDYFFNIIQSIIELVFFYHPAVWFLSRQIRVERENSCDNIAIQITGDKNNYIRTLAAMQIKQTQAFHVSLAFSGNKGSVLHRIKRLQKQIAMKTNISEGLIAATVIIVGLILASFTFSNTSSGLIKDSFAANSQSMSYIPDRDSLMLVVEERIAKEEPDEQQLHQLEKAIEVAISENDSVLSSEILAEIDRTMQEINVDRIVKEALQEAAFALKEASYEVEQARRELKNENINRDMREASREIAQARREVEYEMRRDMEAEGISPEIIDAAVSAAITGLDVAANVVGNLDIEGIVSSALNGVSAVLGSLGEIEIDDSDNQYYDSIPADEQKARIKQLEKEKKQLQKEQADLEKRIKRLEKKLEDL